MGHLFPGEKKIIPQGVLKSWGCVRPVFGHDAFRLRPHIFDWVQVGPTRRPIKELHFVLFCEPSLKFVRLVDRRLILLEINYPIRIHFSHCGDYDISQYVEILIRIEATT
jgi:hypothetical protein